MGLLKDSIDMVASSKSERYRQGLELRHDEDSPLHCDQCHVYLGFLRMFKSAMLKRPGSTYVVVCRCGHRNNRVKGALRQ